VDRILKVGKKISQSAQVIAGISLVFLLLLTVADVILRFFHKPIAGTYELVAFGGAVAIGFSLPFTSWTRGHIYVDFLLAGLPKKFRAALNISTRGLGLALFLIIGWNLLKFGTRLRVSGEVSPTLQLPFYPVVYGVGFCCFLQSLILFFDVLKILRDAYE
jgi:TRAP-type C4-dicarboxylate transport system permease small subunit